MIIIVTRPFRDTEVILLFYVTVTVIQIYHSCIYTLKLLLVWYQKSEYFTYYIGIIIKLYYSYDLVLTILYYYMHEIIGGNVV